MFLRLQKKYSTIGFDKNLNKSIPIYGRILLENIRNAIIFKKDKLILGRTANEFKSNFGAEPKKSFIYVRFTNIILNFLAYIFLVTLQPPEQNSEALINLVLGYLGGLASAVISFYFGASQKQD